MTAEVKFASMKNMNMAELVDIRDRLRESLATAIQKKNAIKGEIMFLQAEIEKLENEH